VGEGLRRCRVSFSAAILARNSAACLAAACIASVPGMTPLARFAAGQFARDTACDLATSSSGSSRDGDAPRARLGDCEREPVSSRSRSGGVTLVVCGGFAEGEGERERAVLRASRVVGWGAPCAGGGVRGRVACFCVALGASGACGLVGAGEGEREACLVRSGLGGGGPSVRGGVLRSTAAPENPVRRGVRGLLLCPCLFLCLRLAGRPPHACARP
jgi:hypothetical protein